MRLIDADAMLEEVNTLYRESAKRKDTELMKLLAISGELVNKQPTVRNYEESYQQLDYDTRLAIDTIIHKLKEAKEHE